MEQTQSYQKKILTIPNILSCVRLAMIPVIVWCYCVKQNFNGTTVLLILSGLTDLADGFIARRFHMISDLGKILDPIADKLTQAAVLFCLATDHTGMWALFALLCVKEVCMAILGAVTIKRTGTVNGAVWHGKVTTTLLYATMTLHILWPPIPVVFSHITILICAAMMLLSFILYGRRNIRDLRNHTQMISRTVPKGERVGRSHGI